MRTGFYRRVCAYGLPLFLLTMTMGAVRAQAVADEALRIIGAPTAVAFSLDDLGRLPRSSVTLTEDGRQVLYEGVLVEDLLRRADVPLGSLLRGSVLSSYVIARGADDYRVLFSLWELDRSQSGHTVLVADRRDGQALDGRNGPLRLVVPDDLRAARSVRMLKALEFVRLYSG